jgi:hypothetical protein
MEPFGRLLPLFNKKKENENFLGGNMQRFGLPGNEKE